jgi:4-amino-4-deoxy-L-arabinose transferase-like glycosyltransferase
VQPILKATRGKLLLILAASFCVRIALIVVFKTYSPPVLWEYEDIARNLLSGAGYSFNHLGTTYWSSGTPLYAFLCAAIYAVTDHSYLAVLIVQSLFSLALAFLVFEITRMAFSEWAGLIAAAMVSFHPAFLFYDVFNLLPQSIDTFLIAAIPFVLLKYRRQPSAKAMLLLGVLVGIGALSRGIIGVLLPFVILYLIFFARTISLKGRLKLATCVLAGTFLILSPWLIRNYVVHRQGVFISSTTGELFWRGNNALATGTSQDRNKTPIFNLWPDDFRGRVYARPELEQKAFFESEAREFIRSNPRAAFSLYLKKVYYFWWFSPQSGLTYPQSYLAVYKLFYVAMLLFSLVGIIFGLRTSREPTLILLAIMLTICLGQSIFYVEGRHRWLVEPLLIVFCAYGVTTAAGWFMKKATSLRS